MNRRTIAIVIVCSIIIFFIWLFLSSFGTAKLTIKTPEATPGNTEISITITRDGQFEQELTLAPGASKTLRLKKGTLQIDGSAGNLKGVDVVEVGQTKELLTPAGQQHVASKIGSNAVFCPVVLEDKVFSYSCFDDGRVVQHTTPNQSRTMFNDQVFAQMQPLKNGLIGLYRDKFSELQFLDLTKETVQRLQLPAAVQTEFDKEFPQIVVSTDPGASYFAMMFVAANKIYLMDDITDTSPVEITPSFKIAEAGRLTTPSFSNKEFILFAGNERGDHTDGVETEEATNELSELPSYIFEYNLEGNLARTINLPEKFDADIGMYRLANNYYEVEQNASIDFYYLEGDSLRQIYEVHNVSNWVNLNNTVYLQVEGVMYQFVPSERGLFGLHSVFSSTDLDVSRVYASVRGPIFTATVLNATNSLLNIYQLLDSVEDPAAPLAPSIQTETRFAGLETLLEYGVSADQVQGLRDAIKAYIDKSGTAVETASVSSVTIQAPQLGSSAPDAALFDLDLDAVSYKAKMEYFALSDMRLLLYNQDGSVLFDSGAE